MATNVGNSWFIFTQLMQGHELRSTPHSKILFKFVCKECNWVLLQMWGHALKHS